MDSKEKKNTQESEFPTLGSTFLICLSFPFGFSFLAWQVSRVFKLFFKISDETISNWTQMIGYFLIISFVLWLIRLTLYHSENATKALNEIRELREEIKNLRMETQKEPCSTNNSEDSNIN